MHIKYFVNVNYIFPMAALLLIFSFASPPNMVRLRAFINGTVMHLLWGYLHRRNYASVANILKVENF